jgi:hypothetical protein
MNGRPADKTGARWIPFGNDKWKTGNSLGRVLKPFGNNKQSKG